MNQEQQVAVSNNFWEPGWTTSAIDDMKSNGGRQLGVQPFIKRRVEQDARLDNTEVEVRMTADRLIARDIADETVFSMKMYDRLKNEVRKLTPACAECGNVKSETHRSINPRDLHETITAIARCTQVAGPHPSMACPKRVVLFGEKPAAAWPTEPEIYEPVIEQSPDVPQNYADAW